MSDYIQVLTTTARRDEAERIARALIDSHLAACVQIQGPITSIYRWKGAVETSEEWQCSVKSRADLFLRIKDAILELHPYEVPEILAVPMVAGGDRYLAWIDEEVGPSGGS